MTFRNAFDRMIAARERQARLYVNGALMNMDDETLRRAGVTRDELRTRASRVSAF